MSTRNVKVVTMSTNHALRQLWWKECRQLIPLVLLIVVVAIGLAGLSWISSLFQGHRQTLESPGGVYGTAFVLALFAPCLFALGAGGVLIGQEKESGTLNWLRGLPISRSQVVGSKVLAGVVGLIAAWLVCGLIALLVLSNQRSVAWWDTQNWLLYSVFLLMTSMAVCWRLRSGLVAMLVMVPISFLPMLLATIHLQVATWNRGGWDNFDFQWLVSFWLAIGTVVSAVLVWRFAFRELGPSKTHGWSWLTAWTLVPRRQIVRTSIVGRAVNAPLAALLWQHARLNRPLLVWAVGGLVVAAIFLWIALLREQVVNATGYLFVFANWLSVGISLLGAAAFQGDAARQQIRFLADRGVSPRFVWWSRQAIPVSIIAMSLAAFVLMIYLWGIQARGASLSDLALAVAVVFLASGWIYSVTQWVSQLTASPVIALVACPICGWVVVWILLPLAATQFEAPLGLLAVAGLLPLVITRIQVRRWMDRRFGKSYWVRHAAGLLLFLMLPAAPLLWEMATGPRIDRRIARQLDAEVRQVNLLPQQLDELVLSVKDQRGLDVPLAAEPDPTVTAESDDEPAGGVSYSLTEEKDRLQRLIADQLDRSSGPLHVASLPAINFLRTRAILARLTSPESVEEAAELELRYRNCMDLLLKSAQGLRRSQRLIEQDAADQVEIGLLREVLHEGAEARLGGPLYQQLVEHLGNMEVRNVARRRAVAALWWQRGRTGQASAHENDLGGDYLQATRHIPSVAGLPGGLRSQLSLRQRSGVAIGELWRLVSSSPDANTTSRLQRIALYTAGTTGPVTDGLAAPYLRADDPQRYVEQMGDAHQLRLASQWYAGWEQLARQLAEHGVVDPNQAKGSTP